MTAISQYKANKMILFTNASYHICQALILIKTSWRYLKSFNFRTRQTIKYINKDLMRAQPVSIQSFPCVLIVCECVRGKKCSFKWPVASLQVQLAHSFRSFFFFVSSPPFYDDIPFVCLITPFLTLPHWGLSPLVNHSQAPPPINVEMNANHK